jgi:hypothetical protein
MTEKSTKSEQSLKGRTGKSERYVVFQGNPFEAKRKRTPLRNNLEVLNLRARVDEFGNHIAGAVHYAKLNAQYQYVLDREDEYFDAKYNRMIKFHQRKWGLVELYSDEPTAKMPESMKPKNHDRENEVLEEKLDQIENDLSEAESALGDSESLRKKQESKIDALEKKLDAALAKK